MRCEKARHGQSSALNRAGGNPGAITAEKPTARLFRENSRAFHVSQRNGLYVDLQGHPCCNSKELCNGLEDLIYRCASETASKKLNRGATQASRGQRNSLAGTLTHLNKSDARALAVYCRSGAEMARSHDSTKRNSGRAAFRTQIVGKR